MAKTGLTISVSIEGLQETLRKLRDLPKDASNELRDKATELSRILAKAAAESGRAEGSQAELVATTVKALRDRVPVVVAGGSKRLGSKKKPAYKLLFGSEFGANVLHQYKPHIGTDSYWFFKVIEDKKVEIAAEWQRAADEVIRKFGEGG